MAAAENRRVTGGRRSKGDRKLIAFRVATPKAHKVTEIAHAEGYKYVSDWLAAVVDERIDKTDLSQIDNQETLPIGRIAS